MILIFIRLSIVLTLVLTIIKPLEPKLLTRLELSLRSLCEYEFENSFQDSLNPFCNCENSFSIWSGFFVKHCNIVTYIVTF